MTAINSNRAIRGPVTAVPVVAGKGVRLVADTENNRWVVEADETVLYSNDNPSQITSNTNFSLSESYLNFERIKLVLRTTSGSTVGCSMNVEGDVFTTGETELASYAYTMGNVLAIELNNFVFSPSSPMSCSAKSGGSRIQITVSAISSQSSRGVYLYKIIGVNRIASN